MRSLWNSLRWLLGKAIFLAALMLAALCVFMLPIATERIRHSDSLGVVVGVGYSVERYWQAVAGHLSHWARGTLVPTLPNGEALPPGSAAAVLPEIMRSSLPVTLTLLGGALLASLVLGVLAGSLLSRHGPRWLRPPLWGGTALLLSLPDLLMITAIQVGVLYAGRTWGFTWPILGEPAALLLNWKHYVVPWAALTLLPLPYIARATAAAVDEASTQLYVRSAVARGIGPARLLFKHVGRNALVRIWATLPAVAGVLLSGIAVVEYMADMPGVAREVIKGVTPRTRELYLAVAYLLPLLALYVLVDAVSDGGQRLLDPRLRSHLPSRHEDRFGGWRTTLAGLREAAAGLLHLPRALVRLPAALAAWVWEVLQRLPAALWSAVKGMRDPVLFAGTVLTLALVAVAVFAPQIAPFDPQEQAMAYLDESGKIVTPPYNPGEKHWLGTDDLGRDMFSRIVFGTRWAMVFAALAVPARFLLALLFGLLAAWRGGIWEGLVRRLAVFFTATPAVLLPLTLIPALNDLYMERTGVLVFWGVFLVALPGFPRLAESIRQQAREVMAQPFIEGARAVGAQTGRTLTRYIMPALAPHLATMAALEVPVIMTMTAILGLFRAYPGGVLRDTETFAIVGPVMPEWGTMMDHPFRLLKAGGWWMWAPFAALFVAVLAFNLLGEGLRRRWASRTGWQ